MILDLGSFVAAAKPGWDELEDLLTRMENGTLAGDLDSLERCYRLYERACADLARLSTFAAAPEVQGYLETLVARAYSEVHESRRRSLRFSPFRLLTVEFPQVFRRHARAFALAVLVTLSGAAFGALALLVDPSAKRILMPFPHLLGDPQDRVEAEESADGTPAGLRATFSAQLFQHNTRIAILCLGLGVTFGFGTAVVLFYNGVILGAVVTDYLQAGEGVFLAGWLLPHGVVEIPAVLIAGQAGLVLARSMLAGRAIGETRHSLRAVRRDLVALASGFACLLLWAGLIESFLSQTHEPVLPYSLKIALGLGELGLLGLFLSRAGKERGQ